MSTMAWVWISDSEKRSMSAALAASTLRDALMMRTTSSMFSMAMTRPSRMWARSSALRSSYRVRLVITSTRWSTKHLIRSLSDRVLGMPADEGQVDDAEGGLQLAYGRRAC